MSQSKHCGDIVPFREARAEVQKFEEILASYEIRVRPGSDLERVGIIISELEDMRAGRSAVDLTQDPRPVFRKAVGLLEFIAMLNRQHAIGGLDPFVEHLELLNIARSVAPGVRTLRDEAANKLFELYWAMVCLSVGTDLVLDSPSGAKGDNPDVLVTIDGRRWGFACKAIEGQNPLSWYELLKKGLEQIDKSPDAETGCVVLNPGILVNHDVMWPLLNPDYAQQDEPAAFGCWIDEGAVGHLLYQTADIINLRLIRKNGREQVENLFRVPGRKSILSILSVMQTVCQIVVAGRCPASTVAFLASAVIGTLSEKDTHVLQRLNHSLQRRLQNSALPG